MDEVNCRILNILQENCRASLTEIAKQVNLSVDSVKKRIDKLIKDQVFYPRIQLRPRHFGYPYIVDVKVKLKNFEKKRIDEFIKYVTAHPRVSEFFSFSGEYNFSIVLIAKDHGDLDVVSGEIKEKFSDIIGEWVEAITTIAYKFERYDLKQLMEYEQQKREKSEKCLI